MTTGPKSGWGGAREGAGRPKETLSAQQVRLMLQKAKVYSEKYGKEIDEILLDFIYDEGSSKRERAQCIKLWKEYTMARLQEGGEADRQLGPAVFLPEHHPRLKAV